MKCAAGWGVLLWGLTAAAQADTLTLEEALASVAAPHPDRRVAESDLAVARADRDEAASIRDFKLFIDGELRSGHRPEGDWQANNSGRIVARKPLLDFGRSSQAVAAAEQDVAARQAALLSMENLRRLDIMARYFDVLLADMQFAIDSEFFAVRYTMWDHAQQRFEQGQINRAALLALDAEHQATRARRDASQQRMRSTRQKLAHAIARPGSVLTDLAEPELKNAARPLPEYEAMLAWVMRHNPRVLSLRAQLAAADARLAAVRAERNPALEAEVQGGRYSRPSSTRDEVSAGLIFTIPLYQGGRVDAREARERANRERSLAELEKLAYDLADALLATLQEIEWLRDSSAAAADRQIAYRDSALERARAEYELELQSNLGDSLAETQVAALRRRQVDYQWALAWARLEGLSGGVLPPVERTQE